MSNQPKLKALLIGIDHYQESRANLKGCGTDVYNMESYLKELAKQQSMEPCIKKLQNTQATYDNVTQTFQSHFNNISPNDLCVFFFSGHGSRRKPPFELLDPSQSSGQIESLICHDSRPNGYDLLDKELAWLIWSVMPKEPKHPFLLIVDSCHSGDIYRDPEKTKETVKAVPPSKALARGFKDILGHEDFIEDKQTGIYQAPPGNYVMLSSCLATEEARIKTIKAKRQSIFTYYLLDTLRKQRRHLTYQELVLSVKQNIQRQVVDQTPNLVGLPESNILLPAFSIEATQDLFFTPPEPLAFYHKGQKNWVINCGSQTEYHLSKGDLVYLFPEDAHEKDILPNKAIYQSEILVVRPDYCVIKTIEANERMVFQFVTDPEIKLLPKVAFLSKESSTVGLQNLEAAWNSGEYREFLKVDNPDDSDYLILIEGNSYTLISTKEQLKLPYTPLSPMDATKASQVLKDLRKVIRWNYIKKLQHSALSIALNHFTISLQEVSNTPQLLDHTSPIALNYQGNKPPLIDLAITAQKELYFSFLRLGEDCSIKSDWMDSPVKLGLGESLQFLSTAIPGIPGSKQISLEIPAPHLKLGYHQWTEHLKIFISNQPIDVLAFVQNGINYRQKGVYRDNSTRHLGGSRFSRSELKAYDWTVIDLLLHITKPEP